MPVIRQQQQLLQQRRERVKEIREQLKTANGEHRALLLEALSMYRRLIAQNKRPRRH